MKTFRCILVATVAQIACLNLQESHIVLQIHHSTPVVVFQYMNKKGLARFRDARKRARPPSFESAGRHSLLWGISTVGSALHSHCRGHRFESGMLHHEPVVKTGFFFCFHATDNQGPPSRRAFSHSSDVNPSSASHWISALSIGPVSNPFLSTAYWPMWYANVGAFW